MKFEDQINLMGLRISAQLAFMAAIDTLNDIRQSEKAAANLREGAKQAHFDFAHIANHAGDERMLDRFLSHFLEVADMEILYDESMSGEVSERLKRAKQDVEGYIAIMNAYGMTEDDTRQLGHELGTAAQMPASYLEDMLRLSSAQSILMKADRAVKRSLG